GRGLHRPDGRGPRPAPRAAPPYPSRPRSRAALLRTPPSPARSGRRTGRPTTPSWCRDTPSRTAIPCPPGAGRRWEWHRPHRSWRGPAGCGVAAIPHKRLAHAALEIDLGREAGQRAEPAGVRAAPRRRARRGRPALDRRREFGETEHDVDHAFDGNLLGVVADVDDLTGGLRGRHESGHRLDGVGDVAEGAALLEAVDLERIFSGQ